jgi:hypothetical protein
LPRSTPRCSGSGRRVALDAGVVAGRDGVGAEAARALGERRELEVAVAVRAGQRRPAGGVLATKFDDHLLVELRSKLTM